MKEQQYSFEDAWRPRNGSPKLSRSGVFAIGGVGLLLVAWYSDVFASLCSLTGHQLAWPLEAVPIGAPERQGSSAFEWSSISASSSLEFTSCFGDLECAKLQLPLDYFNNTHESSTISLAVVKIPAKVPVTDPRYGGPILVNPGGPGGSGTYMAAALGKDLQSVVDAPEYPETLTTWEQQNASSAKYYDIIGFDPRGVAHTEPRAACMADFPSAWSWTLREDAEGLLGTSDAAIGRLWSMSHAFGGSCAAAMEAEGGPDIKQYLTTASVARDMLELVEKHAEYVNKRVRDIVTQNAVKNMIRPALPNFTPGESKIQYWGFSYGTFLGNTFASMFPSRVGKMVLDGVVDADEYLINLGNVSLRDNEKVVDKFYDYCAAAGESVCPLAYEPHGSSPETIKTRVQSILQSLYHNPLPVSSPNGPDVITYSDVKKIIFGCLYSPAATFQYISHVLYQIGAGNGNELAQLLRPQHVYSCPLSPGNSTNDDAIAEAIQGRVAMTSIMCSDGNDVRNTTFDEFTRHFESMTKMSPTSGAMWVTLPLKCIHWPIRSVYRFTGPFSAKTANPILWVGNTADPVTPLISARKMRKQFEGSGLVVVEGAGHCSSAVEGFAGTCAIQRIKGYFQGTEEVDGEDEIRCEERTEEVEVPEDEAGYEAWEAEREMEIEVTRARLEIRRYFDEHMRFFGFGNVGGMARKAGRAGKAPLKIPGVM